MSYTERKGNLFSLNKNEYIFAHCIASDLRWGAGIAPILIKEFDAVSQCRYKDDGGEVTEKLTAPGILPVTTSKGTFVNLLTKENTYGKPTHSNVVVALSKLFIFMKEHNYTKLAMPKIGCGLDGLEWEKVSDYIKSIFGPSDIDVTIMYKD